MSFYENNSRKKKIVQPQGAHKGEKMLMCLQKHMKKSQN